MLVNAGRPAKRSQLRFRMSGMLAKAWTSISAGTPGGYDLSHTFLTPLACVTVAMRSPLPESGKCNLSARPPNELRGGGIQPAGEQRTGGTMARKTGTSGTRDDDAAKAFADSAQRIWLAGLGAFERARTEGPRMFDALVEQGKTLGGRAREAADQALRNVRDTA